MRKKVFFCIVLFMIECIFVYSYNITYAFSTEACISEIKIAQGDGAILDLEEDGYIADYQNLNFTSGTGEPVYLGYKYGKEAITDIVVSSDLKSSMEINDITYTPVSDIDVHEGMNGGSMYIYSTKDQKAGSEIAALTKFKRTPKKDEELPDFYGDGSEIIRTVDGEAADFAAGIEGYNLYFFMIRNALCLPYVSEVKTVNVAPDDELLAKLASTGCDYYMENPLSVSGENKTYLCYNRTADVNQSVRYVMLSNTSVLGDILFESAGNVDINGETEELYYTKSSGIGGPVTDITLADIGKEKFTLGEWASIYFAGKTTIAKSMIYADEDYDELINSDEPLIRQTVKVYENENVWKAMDLYAIFIENGFISNNDEVGELPVEHFNGGDFAEPKELKNLEDGILRDTREIDVVDDDKEIDNILNDIPAGKGNTVVLVVLSVIAVVGVVVFILIYKRKKQVNKRSD